MKEKEIFERLFLSNVMSKNSSLMFTVEQWELTRRLRLSGLTKEQVCQAFDDLDKIEKDLSYLFANLNNMPVSSTTSNQNDVIVKNFQMLIAKNIANITQQQQQQNQQHQQQIDVQPTAALNIVNNHFSKLIDPDLENKEIDEFKSKGEVAIHSEISFFVYKHDLKQSQISRMAGVNQAYVSKFLRGEFFELSENGKLLIYKWYLRFLKNPAIYLQTHKVTLGSTVTSLSNSDSFNLSNTFLNSPISKLNQYSSFANNVTNLTHEAPKRTRFSFKPEHLAILENAFSENQYPDQKKREEITRLCNGSRNCSDREKVTEQVITHWFQNKRKITRKMNVDDSTKSPDEMKNDNLIKLEKKFNSTEYHHTNSSNNSPLNYNDYLDDTSHATAFKTVISSKSNSSPSKSNYDSSDDMY